MGSRIMGITVPRYSEEKLRIWVRNGCGACPVYRVGGMDNLTYTEIIRTKIENWEPERILIKGGGFGEAIFQRLRDTGVVGLELVNMTESLKTTLFKRLKAWSRWIFEEGDDVAMALTFLEKEDVRRMTENERNEIKQDLMVFVRRVCRAETGSLNQCPEEVRALPDIARLLLEQPYTSS
jgi:hypothetical protein